MVFIIIVAVCSDITIKLLKMLLYFVGTWNNFSLNFYLFNWEKI